jgi:hypothetical protein
MEKVPDAKTLVRLGQAIGPETIAELQERIVALAQKRGVNEKDRTENGRSEAESPQPDPA